MKKKILELYRYREMIYNLIRRELRGKYQKSVLGMLWMLINPLFQVLIFSIVFTYIFPSNIDNYPVHLIVALIPWTFFADSMINGTGIIVNNANMTKKIYFPKEVLAISTVTSKMINMLISFVIVFIFIIVAGIPLNLLAILCLPLVILIEYIITLGFVILTSAICVYFRDVEHIVTILMQALVWCAPVMYSINNISGILLNIINLNPFTSIILAYRDILYYGKLPNANSLLISSIIAISVLLIAEIVFIKCEPNFAEEL